MAIYNILIVDDEELICKGLKSMIERSSLDEVGKVSYTTEPAKVQNMLEELNTNIIITDVRMPEVSGLDLIKNISRSNLNIKFIVLSGYDDFKYVKEAFKLGAFDYLLKPGSLLELKAIMEKVINTIKEEERNKLNQQNNTHKYMEAVLENRFNKVFSGNKLKVENTETLFKELNISFPYDNFSIGMMFFYNNISESKNVEIIRLYLDKVAEGIIDRNELAIYYFYNLNNNVVFIFNYTNKVNLDKLNKYLQVLMQLLGENLGLNCFASISDSESEIKSIGPCYFHAAEALSYKLIYDFNKVIRYSDVRDKENIEDNFNWKPENIKEYIVTYNTVAISDFIDTIFSRKNIERLSIQSTNKLYNKTISKIKNVIDDNKLTFFNDEFKEFMGFGQLSDLKIYLKTLVFEVVNMLKERSTGKSISDIVKKYVQENYHKDIDMTVVSNIVSLSYSHFSKIFKDETGMNFSDYLLKVRMEKALELLSNPVNKIHEVAEKIGYSNSKHFTRAFKTHYGFSPSEFRGNI
jgi:two-component system response regulator YesN